MSTQQTPAYATPIVPEFEFHDRLRKARQTARLDQRSIAQLLGRTAGAYSQWESGVTRPRDIVAVARDIERITNVSATWLLGLDEPSGPTPVTQRGPRHEGEGLILLPEMDSNHQPAGFKPWDGFTPATVPLTPAAIVIDPTALPTIEPSIEDVPEREQPALVTAMHGRAA